MAEIPVGFRIMPIVNNWTIGLSNAGNNYDQNYFYSEYDKNKKFYYTIDRDETDEDNKTNDEWLANKQEAWLKCFNYHISFQRLLPNWIKFYGFKSIIDPTTNPITIDTNENWFELSTMNVGPINKTNYENRYLFNDTGFNMADKIYLRQQYLTRTNPSAQALTTLTGINIDSNNLPDFENCVNSINATLVNKLIYELAFKVIINFPSGLGWDEHDYVAQLQLVNNLFNFNLPMEPGTYIKYKNNWYIDTTNSNSKQLIVYQEQMIKEVINGG